MKSSHIRALCVLAIALLPACFYYPLFSSVNRALFFVCSVILIAYIAISASGNLRTLFAVFWIALASLVVTTSSSHWHFSAFSFLFFLHCHYQIEKFEVSGMQVKSLGVFSLMQLIDSSGILWAISELAFQAVPRFSVSLLQENYGSVFYIGGGWMQLGAATLIVHLISLRQCRRLVFGAAFVTTAWCVAAVSSSELPSFIGAMVSLWLLPLDHFRAPTKTWVRVHAVAGACSIIAIISLVKIAPLCEMLAESPSLPRHVLFIKGGLGEFEVPALEDTRVEAEYGGLLCTLDALGWKAEAVELSEFTKLPDGLGVLFVVCPKVSFTASQKFEVFRFVSDGGTLVVLGDHTDIAGICGPLNDLLEPVGVEFNFDSAIPESQGWTWRNCLRASSLQNVLHCQALDELAISVGASLACDYRGKILVEGTRAFSDAGRPDYGQSRLGDMACGFGERRGGLPLVVEVSHGSGRVQVWGDTAAFQNRSVGVSGDFIGNLFESYLHSSPDLALLGPVFVLLSFTLFLLSGNSAFVAMAIAMLLSIAGELVTTKKALSLSNDSVLCTRWGCRYTISGHESCFGMLADICLRGQQRLHISPEIFGADKVFLVSPTVELTTDDSSMLYDYVSQGGTLIVAIGPESADVVHNLAARFDFAVTDTLLGAAHQSKLCDRLIPVLSNPKVDQSAPAQEANEYSPDLTFKESYAISMAGEVVCSCWGEPLIIRQQVGRGRIVVIGDPRFLKDENLGETNGTIEVIKLDEAKVLLSL